MTTREAPALALDRRIRADLEQKIHSGEWAPGHRIPVERELMALYGCARMTVQKAISALVERGLVVRRKRAGSFVARPHIQTAVLEIPDIGASIAARGDAYRFEVLSRRIEKGHLENDGVSAAKSRLLMLQGVHFSAGRPFALEYRSISLSIAPKAATADFSEHGPGAWLLHTVPWSEARHRIAAVNPTPEEAKLLAISKTTACLQIERWTWRLGKTVTFVRQLFPGDNHHLIAEFGPKRD
jgi:GntR family histidine utilization transcriptional repressor